MNSNYDSKKGPIVPLCPVEKNLQYILTKRKILSSDDPDILIMRNPHNLGRSLVFTHQPISEGETLGKRRINQISTQNIKYRKLAVSKCSNPNELQTQILLSEYQKMKVKHLCKIKAGFTREQYENLMKELEFTGPMVDKFQRALKDANIYAPGGQKIYRELMHRNTFAMDCGIIEISTTTNQKTSIKRYPFSVISEVLTEIQRLAQIDADNFNSVWHIGQRLDTYYSQFVFDHGKHHNAGGTQSMHALATHSNSNYTTILLIEGADEPRALNAVSKNLFLELSKSETFIEIDFPEFQEEVEEPVILFDTDVEMYDHPCEHCDLYFQTKNDLDFHTQNTHKYFCDSCTRSFKTQNSLTKHKNSHYSFIINSKNSKYAHSKIRGSVPRIQLKKAKQQFLKRFRQNNIKIS